MKQIQIKEYVISSWSLQEGDTQFGCDHEDYHFETVEVDTMRNGEHDTYETQLAVCSTCDETLEDIEPDIFDEIDD